MAGLEISWNANICHRIIVSIAYGIPKEVFLRQGRYTSIGHISAVHN